MFRLIAALLAGVGLCVAQEQGVSRWREQRILDKLQQNPNDIDLLLTIAALKIDNAGTLHEGDARTAVLDEAQSYCDRVLAIDPDNIHALSRRGIAGWMRVFPELVAARARLSMEPETPGPLPDRNLRAILSGRYGRFLAESIFDLERVAALDRQNNDAMGYLNLVYRAKADLEDTAEAARRDNAAADRWTRKALEAGSAKADAGGSPQPSPATPIPERSKSSDRIRVNADLQAAKLVHRVDPVYPEEAKNAGIQGIVRFSATIAKDGTIANLEIISGHPLLTGPGLDAVRQWSYRPTLLNNEPVEVTTTIDVMFSLP